jgi:hypothetical protein
MIAGKRGSETGGVSVVAKRIFVSFDFDNDRALKDFIIGQAKNSDSPFEVIDHSLQEAAPEADWLRRARAGITRADVVITMLGPKTRFASGVKKEIAIAKELSKARFQVIGYQNGSQDWAVIDAGRTYDWNWENLKKLLA